MPFDDPDITADASLASVVSAPSAKYRGEQDFKAGGPIDGPTLGNAGQASFSIRFGDSVVSDVTWSKERITSGQNEALVWL